MPRYDACAWAIGHFLLTFGAFEWHLLVFLEKRLPPDQFAAITKRSFQEKLQRVEVLLAQPPLACDSAALQAFHAQAEEVRELRNHLAHGYLYFNQTACPPSLTVTMSEDMDAVRQPETEHLTTESILQACAKVTLVIDRLNELSGDWKEEEVIELAQPDSGRDRPCPTGNSTNN